MAEMLVFLWRREISVPTDINLQVWNILSQFKLRAKSHALGIICRLSRDISSAEHLMINQRSELEKKGSCARISAFTTIKCQVHLYKKPYRIKLFIVKETSRAFKRIYPAICNIVITTVIGGLNVKKGTCNRQEVDKLCMPKLLFAKRMVTSLSACQGMLFLFSPMTSQDVRLLKENNTDGLKFAKGHDFHNKIAQRFLIIKIL